MAEGPPGGCRGHYRTARFPPGIRRVARGVGPAGDLRGVLPLRVRMTSRAAPTGKPEPQAAGRVPVRRQADRRIETHGRPPQRRTGLGVAHAGGLPSDGRTPKPGRNLAPSPCEAQPRRGKAGMGVAVEAGHTMTSHQTTKTPTPALPLPLRGKGREQGRAPHRARCRWLFATTGKGGLRAACAVVSIRPAQRRRGPTQPTPGGVRGGRHTAGREGRRPGRRLTGGPSASRQDDVKGGSHR